MCVVLLLSVCGLPNPCTTSEVRLQAKYVPRNCD